MLHTILGAGGAIATPLAQELSARGIPVRLVSRNPKRVNESDELFSADLTNAARTREAVRGSEVVYLMPGLPYKVKVWRNQWPAVMRNTLDACKAEGAKLVFLDNVYGLGQCSGRITEDLPLNPCSKKGTVRAEVDRMMLAEMAAGSVQGIIARAPDFYGPLVKTSALNSMMLDGMPRGKKPLVILNLNKKHSYIYTPDAGKACALLGTSPTGWGEVWNLPVAQPHLNHQQLLELAAQHLGVPTPKPQVLSKFILRTFGWFNSLVGEMYEMLYQFEYDYQFDSSKFNRAFPAFTATPYANGIAAALDAAKAAAQ